MVISKPVIKFHIYVIIIIIFYVRWGQHTFDGPIGWDTRFFTNNTIKKRHGRGTRTSEVLNDHSPLPFYLNKQDILVLRMTLHVHSYVPARGDDLMIVLTRVVDREAHEPGRDATSAHGRRDVRVREVVHCGGSVCRMVPNDIFQKGRLVHSR